MCCSFWKIKFSNTITGTYEALVDGRINHVLWYQNNVGEGVIENGMLPMVFEVCVRHAMSNPNWVEVCRGPMEVNNIEPSFVWEEAQRILSGKPRRRFSEIPGTRKTPELIEGEGNCLVIPLLGKWGSLQLLNTSEVPNILIDVSNSLKLPQPRRLMVGSSYGGSSAIIFLQFSIYDIVIAENASALPSVLSQINPLKRPKINEEVFNTLEAWYQCPIAVCCFNNGESGSAKPLAFAFEPLYPERLVVYTLDSHDGQRPDPSALVNLDHTVFVGSYLTPGSMCAHVSYQDEIPAHLRPYLPLNVMGTPIGEKMENGDIIFSTADVRAGIFDGLRSLPPFGPQGVPRLGHRVTRSDQYVLNRD
ncbi:MAG: hypothetical protein K2X77_24480 [Candidatus Obscuribacterales bacterium]|jgi:hypothetical protein|nr:hypothetical protein [Candidatus Obscuribacterales bacterium]